MKKNTVSEFEKIYQWEQKLKVAIIGLFILFMLLLASRCASNKELLEYALYNAKQGKMEYAEVKLSNVVNSEKKFHSIRTN